MRAITSRLFVICFLPILMASVPAVAKVDDPVVLSRGNADMYVGAGLTRQDKTRSFIWDVTTAIGLGANFELGLPGAVTYGFFNRDDGNGVRATLGIVDFQVNEGRVLWVPAVVLGAKARVAQYAALVFQMDYCFIEKSMTFGVVPTYLRGGGSLMISMGPYLTLGLGLAYQQRLSGSTGDESAMRFVAHEGISIGSVRTRPYADTPLISVHLARWFDIVGHVRFDINSDIDTSALRLLLGVAFYPSPDPHR